MEQSSVFFNNRTQAVRIPKALALPDGVTRVDVIALGRARLITPVGSAWETWFDGPAVSSDAMADREQPESQTRESF